MATRFDSNTPIFCFVIGVGMLTVLIFSTPVFATFSFASQTIVFGQMLFCLFVGGLFGENWLKGLVFGSTLSMLWAICLMLSFFWPFGGGLIFPSGAMWYLFAFPVVILGGSSPLLLSRFVFGWKLVRANTAASHFRFSVEDLMLTTIVIASFLFLGQIPSHATETPTNTAIKSIAFFIAISMLGSLLILLPATYFALRYKSYRERWLGYAIVWVTMFGILFLVLFSMSGLNGFPIAFVVSVALSLPLLLGIEALRMSGYELATGMPKRELASSELNEEFATTERWSKRRWAIGVLVFAIASSAGLVLLDGNRYRFDRELIAMHRRLEERGDYMDVTDRIVTELHLNPTTTDEILENLQGFEDVQILSLAKTQITDEALKTLSKFRRLSSLDLSHTKISDDGLADLRKLKRLHHLSVAHTNVTLPKLAATPLVKNCGSLDVSGLKISDEQLQLLARSNTRNEDRCLFLRDNQLTDEALAKFFQIQSDWLTLDLSGNPIDGSCISELGNVSNLVLENIPLTDAILAAAISPTRFSSPTSKIVLSGTQVTVAALNIVGSGLELGEPGITDSQLKNCKTNSFSKLRLRGKSFDGSCFAIWHPRVLEMNLSGTGVTDETIQYLSNIAGLQILDLSDTAVSDACLPQLRQVLYMNLSRTRITCEGLLSASFAYPQRIQVAIGQFTVEEVRQLKKKLPIVVGKPSGN